MAGHRSEPAVVALGQGLSVENPVGGVLTFKATAPETGGAVTALETIAAPGEGPPLHVHAEDELIYTLEGSFRIRLGFEEFFRRYAALPVDERGTEAFARIATETQAFTVLGPPLAVSDPL
jgi:oxalate decarboxylase/phosphoglucose isomerase-like protein (cupin superfamily)